MNNCKPTTDNRPSAIRTLIGSRLSVSHLTLAVAAAAAAALLFCGAFPVQAAQATLTWTDNANNERGFTVQRKAEVCAGTGTWTDLSAVAANVTTYADVTVAEGGTYCYRLNAWNTIDGTPGGTRQYSAWSNAAGITVPFVVPSAPAGLGVVVTP